LRIISFPLRIKWWNPSNACQKCTIDICHIQTSKMTLFWLRLMYNFNRKFTNFPFFHPSVNRHFQISIITSFHLYAVADWLWARLQTSGTRTIAIYLHSQYKECCQKWGKKCSKSTQNLKIINNAQKVLKLWTVASKIFVNFLKSAFFKIYFHFFLHIWNTLPYMELFTIKKKIKS
jgi:hypothetical protein